MLAEKLAPALGEFTTQVRQKVLDALAKTASPAELEERLRCVLAKPGQILDTQQPARNSQLLLTAYHGLNPVFNPQTIEVAAALELIIAGCRVLDDIQDGELLDGQNRLEAGQWLNTAFYLVCLGQSIISANNTLPSELIVKLHQHLTANILKAIEGQWADLRHEQSRPGVVDGQLALDIASCKSGPILQAIFEAGAIMGGRDPYIVQQAAKFGQLIAVIGQLHNDLKDLSWYQRQTNLALSHEQLEQVIRHSDLNRRKKTVPVVFALNLAAKNKLPEGQALLDYYNQPARADLDFEQYIRLSKIICNSGASLYVGVITQMYRVQGEKIIQELGTIGYPGTSQWQAIIKYYCSD